MKISGKLFKDLDEYSKKIVEKQLAPGPGGNISVRDGEVMWISPSGYSLDDIAPEKWVPICLKTGANLSRDLKPSSEILMHLMVYKFREDVNAIVHTHPPITIGIISTGYNEIPPMFPDYIAIVGKKVPYIDYIIPCSEELANAVVKVMKDPAYTSLFMKNHGLLTLGSNMKQAYYRTEIIEDAAKIFLVSKVVGEPRILNKEETNNISSLEAEKYRQKLLEEG